MPFGGEGFGLRRCRIEGARLGEFEHGDQLRQRGGKIVLRLLLDGAVAGAIGFQPRRHIGIGDVGIDEIGLELGVQALGGGIAIAGLGPSPQPS